LLTGSQQILQRINLLTVGKYTWIYIVRVYTIAVHIFAIDCVYMYIQMSVFIYHIECVHI